MPGKEKFYTSSEVAQLLQMETSSVVKWENRGLLRAYRTPGGHRRIRSSDLVAFLRRHDMWIPAELSAGKIKVLFVDDEPRVLGAMRRAMRAFAETVDFSTAEGGVEALVRVGAEKPDVLVLDVVMPGMDGLEVLERLKASPQTQQIEVIILSGASTAPIAKKALALGAKAVREKPISAQELAALVAAPGARMRAVGAA